jgi:hypothetical protein
MSNDRITTGKSAGTERTPHARRDVPNNRDRLHKPSLVQLECKIDKLDSRLTPEAGPSKSETKSNPHRLVHYWGGFVDKPLNSGDVTKIHKKIPPRATPDYSDLWLSLEDRLSGPTYNWDDYSESMFEKKRILRIPVNTKVKIVQVMPSADRVYCMSDFKIEVLEGLCAGKTGWLSYFDLEEL